MAGGLDVIFFTFGLKRGSWCILNQAGICILMTTKNRHLASKTIILNNQHIVSTDQSP